MTIIANRPLAKSSFWVTIMDGLTANPKFNWSDRAAGKNPTWQKLYYETTWTNFSGINETHQTGNYASGKGTRLYNVIGPRKIEDVQLAAPYNPNMMEEIEDIWYHYKSDPILIIVQPQLPNAEQRLEPVPNSKPYRLEGCQFKTLKEIDVDRESGEPSMMELTFTVDEWSRGQAAGTVSANG